VPYSPEYLKFRSSPIVLDEISKRTGGRLLEPDPITENNQDRWVTAADEIYETRREAKQSSQAIFDWFLVVLCCLIPADVAVRRIQIDMYTIRSWLGYGRKAGPSTATMGTLLERKKAVGEDLKPERKETPLSVAQRQVTFGKPTGAKPSVGDKQPVPQATPAPAAVEEPDDGTTTARLLDLKRRRQQQGDNN
jgi:hypothetical protein